MALSRSSARICSSTLNSIEIHTNYLSDDREANFRQKIRKEVEGIITRSKLMSNDPEDEEAKKAARNVVSQVSPDLSGSMNPRRASDPGLGQHPSVLGRLLTICPHLRYLYPCRKAKGPQADTAARTETRPG